MNTEKPDTAVHDHLLQIHACASEQAFMATLVEVARVLGVDKIDGEPILVRYLRIKDEVIEQALTEQADISVPHASKLKELNERMRQKVRES